MGPQPDGVVVRPVQRDPRESPAGALTGEPLRHQRRLAEAGGRGHQDELGRDAGQVIDEVAALQPFRAHPGRLKLGLQRYRKDRAG